MVMLTFQVQEQLEMVEQAAVLMVKIQVAQVQVMQQQTLEVVAVEPLIKIQVVALVEMVVQELLLLDININS